MSYYGAGDYYGAGGLGSFLGSVGRGIAGAATSFVTSGFNPISAISGGIRGLATPSSSRPQIQLPGNIGINPMSALPGGKPFITTGGGRKRRRMQYTNQKALRRANRRVDGFVREVKKSLKHTNYKLVTKGSTSSKGKKSPAVIVETGPGGVRA